MDQIEVNISQAPRIILRLGHGQRMFVTMIIVPQLGGNKYILSFDQTCIDGSPDTFTGLCFILVVVCTVEKSVSFFDCL